MDQSIEGGALSQQKFTTDPQPLDPVIFFKILFSVSCIPNSPIAKPN